MTGRLPVIPVELLPAPRVICWHGDVEDSRSAAVLVALAGAYAAALTRAPGLGRSAGGNDWSGWHLDDPAAMGALVDLAHHLAPAHWTIER